jgi:serine/threonine protein kinase
VFFEMLTDCRPFQGPAAYVVAAIGTDEPARLSRRLPASLRDIVSRCLMKQPVDRYPSISHLASPLDDLD